MIDLKDLLKAGVHFGHKTSRWSPKMRPFIWGSKNKVHLIDIAKTAFLLERAGKYLKDVTSQGKSVLFVGTKKAAQKTINDIATRLNEPFVTNRWIGGTLTNFEQVKKAITRLLHFQDIVKKPTEHYKKKELSTIQKEIERLEKNIGGILNLSFPPGAIILVDAKKEKSAIHEAINSNIPVIAMVDTNTDPTGINFVIPANDDSPRSITFILEYLAAMIEEGKKLHAQSKKPEKTDQKELADKAKIAAKKTNEKIAKEESSEEVIVEAKPTVKETAVEAKPTVKETAVEAKKAVEKEAPKEIAEARPTVKKTVTTNSTGKQSASAKKTVAKKIVKK
ncbi:MAG: 30S ribosomal protein S2 [bacterium]